MNQTTPQTTIPTRRRDQALSLNMRLLAHHELEGFGGIGEGMAMQLARDGRRILWLAHESAPKNFTGVDVTDPRAPRVVVQTELPHAKVRSNSLDVVGDVMAVAYQTQITGLTPAGFDLFDISVPEQPKRISHFDASGLGTISAGECAALVAEEFAFEQGARNRWTVHFDKRTRLPRRQAVYQPGDDVFAGSALAMNQHRNIGSGDLIEAAAKGLHSVRPAKNH